MPDPMPEAMDAHSREGETVLRTPSPNLPPNEHGYTGTRLADRLGVMLSSRAPVSPLIQAGLDAASEVQRAKLALPPKTYTTIQRSTAPAPSKLKTPKAGPSSSKKLVNAQRPHAVDDAPGPSATPIPEPKLFVPRPRRATENPDLNQPQRRRLSRSGPDDDLEFTRSNKSKASYTLTKEEDAADLGNGDPLGSHLASLGAGGRPKLPGAMALTKPKLFDEAQPKKGESNGQDELLPTWLREQAVLAREQQASNMEQRPQEPERRLAVPTVRTWDSAGSIGKSPGPPSAGSESDTSEESEPAHHVAGFFPRPGNPFEKTKPQITLENFAR